MLYIALLLSQTYVYSCSCIGEVSLEEAVKTHKYIFIAEISTPIELSVDSTVKRFHLHNIESIKGVPTSHYFQDELILKTSCSVTLRAGDQWLVFLNSDEPSINLGGCSSSIPLSYLEREDEGWRTKIQKVLGN